jgi:predicted nucleic acid-binding protein
MTLLDTNILLRMAQPAHSMHQAALDATDALGRQGDVLCIVPQSLYEFWVVATRPQPQNGLGMSIAQVQGELARFRSLFRLLDDTPAIFPEWERLVVQHAVSGKNAHDARLAAAMLVHLVDRILTFNDADFRRFPVTVVTPAEVLAGTGPTP